MDLTAAPTADPYILYRYRDGLYAVDLITAALVEFDFFSSLSTGSATEQELAQRFAFHPRPLHVLLTLCQAMGLMQEQGGQWSLTTAGREFCVRGTDWDLSPYYASLHSRPIARDYVEVLRTGKPAGWSGDKNTADWHKAMEDPIFARKFTAAMDCRGRYLAQVLGKKLDLQGRSRVLDIGGGSGIYACSIAAHHPQISAVVMEQAPVDKICAELIAERGCADRVSVAVGDMFDGLPTDCDVHLYSNVLHDWDIPEVKQLLAVSHAALPTGGMMIIHDAFIHADRSGPLHVAEYSALLMHSTQGKCYSTAEYAQLLEEAGFQPGAYHDTAVGRGYMTAIKR
jgi:predicted O-methyltransferase YrrM